MSVGAFVLEGFGPITDVGTFVLLGFGVGATPTPTPTPTVVASVPLAGGGWSFAIQDKYWRAQEKRYEKKKKEAKKKSKRAVEIIEELGQQELVLSDAIGRLNEELAVEHIKQATVYVELLRLKLALVEAEESDDEFLLLH